MTGSTRATGAEGERIAARHLEKLGYRILERNYSSRLGELDLIACHKRDIVFIEVKTHKAGGRTFGPPELRVGASKRRRISRVAAEYVKRKRIRHRNLRFDVVAVELPDGAKPSIRVFESAFPISCSGF